MNSMTYGDYYADEPKTCKCPLCGGDGQEYFVFSEKRNEYNKISWNRYQVLSKIAQVKNKLMFDECELCHGDGEIDVECIDPMDTDEVFDYRRDREYA